MPDPTAHMSPEEAAAYTKALQKIEACRKSGRTVLNLAGCTESLCEADFNSDHLNFIHCESHWALGTSPP